MSMGSKPERKIIPALVLAILAPGLGRAVAGRIATGILLFVLLVLLWQIRLAPWWLNVIIKFAT